MGFNFIITTVYIIRKNNAMFIESSGIQPGSNNNNSMCVVENVFRLLSQDTIFKEELFQFVFVVGFPMLGVRHWNQNVVPRIRLIWLTSHSEYKNICAGVSDSGARPIHPH